MPFILGIVGLVWGVILGSFWFGVLLCAGGVWVGVLINRSDERRKRQHAAPHMAADTAPASTQAPAADARPPLDDFDSLREEVLALRKRVERLEAGAVTAPAAPAIAIPPAQPVDVAPARPEAMPVPQAKPVEAPAQIQPASPWGREVGQRPVAAEVRRDPEARSEPQPEMRRTETPQTELPGTETPKPGKPVAEPVDDEPSLIARLFSGNIVAKVGVVVLFFGVGFLLKFAYDRGLMPPELRLLGVAAAAVGLFFTGWRLRDTRRLYGLILQGGASGLAYLDVFFALKTYGFIGPALGFGLFALLGVATTVVAVRQDSRTLAVLGLGGAFLAPVLASTGSGNHVLLFSYYMLINLFVLAVSWFRAWRELNLTGWAFTFVIGLFWGRANYRPELFGSVEPFVLAFFAIYLVIPILFATRQPPQLKGLVDGTLVFGTPAAVAFMQSALVRDMPYGLAWSAAIGSALYALLSAQTWRRENMRLLAETYAALAVGLGTLAIFFAFDTYPTFALWTIEGAAILWVGLRQQHRLARAFGILVQLVGVVLFLTEFPDIARTHPVMNSSVMGCLLIAVAAFISSRLLARYADRLDEWESVFAPGMLLWGALWWSVGGLDALHHGVERASMPNGAALFFAASFLLVELAGRPLAWNGLRNLAAFHPLVLGGILVAQLSMNQHPLGGIGGLAWPLGITIAFWSLWRQDRDELAFASRARSFVLWTVLALVATWEELWLLERNRFGHGMLVAFAGYLAAYLRFALRERDNPEASLVSGWVVGWAMVAWFAHGFFWAESTWRGPELLAPTLGLFAASALLYEFAGSALSWGSLRAGALILWPAMAGALLVLFGSAATPFAFHGWMAWPAAFLVAYVSLYRQERDGAAYFAVLRHALGFWIGLVIAGLEFTARIRDWHFGGAWQTSAWGLCAAAALAGAIFWGNLGKWPVFPHRESYRGIVLGPVGAFTIAWALFANFKAPGSMAPLPYLPLLNPVDVMVGLSLAGLWGWSRWFIVSGGEGSGALAKWAGALGFIWLNGIALRSIHYWADVPYEFSQLFRSVLVQSTLSLLWTMAAMALMFLARRRSERGLWVTGAVLLGAVVGKLFLVDLANSGTIARIVSFIGVGGLLLLIGYLAPVPPGEKIEGNGGKS